MSLFGKKYNPILQQHFNEVKTQFDIAQKTIKEGEALRKSESHSGYVNRKTGARVSTTTAKMATKLINDALNTLAADLESIATKIKR